jgi:acyl-CoA thioesterase-1
MIPMRSSHAVLLCAFLATSCGCVNVACSVDAPASGTSAGGSGAPARPVDPTAPPPRPRVVILGDSLTAGLGLVESASYPYILQQLLDRDGYNFEIVNAGVSGDTSAGGLRRLDWALEGDARVLLLALGANDGLRGLSVAEMKENLSTIIDRARARNVVVILAGMEAPPNYGPEYVRSFRTAFRDVAQQKRVVFIPFLLDKVAGNAALNQPDGIHPNAEGARIIADTVWPVLRTLLDQMVTAQ